jgi:hypothetical protein
LQADHVSPPENDVELQKKPVNYRKRHSPEDDRIDASGSVDSRDGVAGPLWESSRDQVSGPLSNAEGVEDLDSELPHFTTKTFKEKVEVFSTTTNKGG